MIKCPACAKSVEKLFTKKGFNLAVCDECFILRARLCPRTQNPKRKVNRNGIRVLRPVPAGPKRLRLFMRNRHCFWCGRQTSLGLPLDHPATATIDHLFSRLHPWRRTSQRPSPVVLACRACNSERGLCDVQLVQFEPKLVERRQIAVEASCASAVQSNQWRTWKELHPPLTTQDTNMPASGSTT